MKFITDNALNSLTQKINGIFERDSQDDHIKHDYLNVNECKINTKLYSFYDSKNQLETYALSETTSYRPYVPRGVKLGRNESSLCNIIFYNGGGFESHLERNDAKLLFYNDSNDNVSKLQLMHSIIQLDGQDGMLKVGNLNGPDHWYTSIERYTTKTQQIWTSCIESWHNSGNTQLQINNSGGNINMRADNGSITLSNQYTYNNKYYENKIVFSSSADHLSLGHSGDSYKTIRLDDNKILIGTSGGDHLYIYSDGFEFNTQFITFTYNYEPLTFEQDGDGWHINCSSGTTDLYIYAAGDFFIHAMGISEYHADYITLEADEGMFINPGTGFKCYYKNTNSSNNEIATLGDIETVRSNLQSQIDTLINQLNNLS